MKGKSLGTTATSHLLCRCCLLFAYVYALFISFSRHRQAMFGCTVVTVENKLRSHCGHNADIFIITCILQLVLVASSSYCSVATESPQLDRGVFTCLVCVVFCCTVSLIWTLIYSHHTVSLKYFLIANSITHTWHVIK